MASNCVCVLGVQPLQAVQVSSVLQLSLAEGQKSCSSQRSALQASMLHDMRAAGLCILQVLSSSIFIYTVQRSCSVSSQFILNM